MDRATIRLEVVSGPDRGLAIVTLRDVCVGTDASADLRLRRDFKVSTRHAVVRNGLQIELEDQTSRNGTWLGEHRVETHLALRDGDVFRVGDTQIELSVLRRQHSPSTKLPSFDFGWEPQPAVHAAASEFAEVAEETYRHVRTLGAGGFGRTYLATEHGGRPVVIKELLDSRVAEQFAFEASSLASLHHPSIVRALRSGQWRRTKRFFIAMTYVEGETFARSSADVRGLPRTRTDHEAVGLILDALLPLRDCANALAYAHDQGVAHRDVKPANIITLDGKGTVIDWGLVARIGTSAKPAGSAFYMSREQAAGEPVSGDMDVYSIGACLYELISGAPPYRATHAHPLDFAEARRIVRSENPVPISQSQPTFAAIAALAMRCLGPPSRRPNMRSLFVELDGIARDCMCAAHKGLADRMSARRVRDGWLCNACQLQFSQEGMAPPELPSKKARVRVDRARIAFAEDADIKRERVLADENGIRSTVGRDALLRVVIEELHKNADDDARFRFSQALGALSQNARCFPALLRSGTQRFVRAHVNGRRPADQVNLDDERFAQLLGGIARFCRSVLALHDLGYSCGARPEDLAVVWGEGTCELVATNVWNARKVATTFSPWSVRDPALRRDESHLVGLVASLRAYPALDRPRFADLRNRIVHELAGDADIHSLLQGIELEVVSVTCSCGTRMLQSKAVLTGRGYFCGSCVWKKRGMAVHLDDHEIAANRKRARLSAQQIVLIAVVVAIPIVLPRLFVWLLMMSAR